jgi:hypothetical protein
MYAWRSCECQFSSPGQAAPGTRTLQPVGACSQALMRSHRRRGERPCGGAGRPTVPGRHHRSIGLRVRRPGQPRADPLSVDRCAGQTARSQPHPSSLTVRVVDEPGLGLVAADRHLERLDDELGALVLRHCPADHPPAEAVEHDGEGRACPPRSRPRSGRPPRAGSALSAASRGAPGRAPAARRAPWSSPDAALPAQRATGGASAARRACDPPECRGPAARRGFAACRRCRGSPGGSRGSARAGARPRSSAWRRSQAWKSERDTPSASHGREAGCCALSAAISRNFIVASDRSPGRRKPRPS